MKFGSLFSGIGGLDLGLERAGMDCRWQVENNPFCQRVLAKHWPRFPRYGDIREVDCNEIEPVDLIAGGFPCQDVSIGKNNAQGILGARSGLWGEFRRIICYLRPRYVLVENVTGLLVPGRGAHRVFADLAHLGYDAEWSVLSACAVGSPQARKRLFIFAYPRGLRIPRSREKAFSRFPAFSWFKDVRSPADLLRRPDLYPPFLCGGGDGIPDRVDRTRALGNAVVPQLGEYLGGIILERDRFWGGVTHE